MKKSHHIRPRAASKFFKASKFSESQATTLNRMVTINLSHTPCSDRQASRVVTALFAKFGRWLRYQSKKAQKAGQPGYGPPAYNAAIEAPGGIHHVHWLVYVPPELEALFLKTLPTWLTKTAGAPIKTDNTIHIQPIKQIMAVSRYCMKGVDRRHAPRCFVKPIDQGVVWGKRVMTSRSLSAKARQKALASAPSAS